MKTKTPTKVAAAYLAAVGEMGGRPRKATEALDVACPACRRGPGDACRQPEDFATTPRQWADRQFDDGGVFHRARVQAAARKNRRLDKRRRRAPKAPASARAHLADIGAKGGGKTSEIKAATARANGAKGGRPRKVRP